MSPTILQWGLVPRGYDYWRKSVVHITEIASFLTPLRKEGVDLSFFETIFGKVIID